MHKRLDKILDPKFLISFEKIKTLYFKILSLRQEFLSHLCTQVDLFTDASDL